MIKSNFKKLVFVAILLSGFVKLHAQEKTAAQKKVLKNYNIVKLTELEKKFRKESTEKREEAYRLAKQNGWKTSFSKPDGSHLQLKEVIDGTPVYYTTYNNTRAAANTRVNFLQGNAAPLNLNLLGQGMTVNVWDGGHIRVSHVENDGLGGNDRASNRDVELAINEADPIEVRERLNNRNHAQHVTGTLIASGVNQNARGMAPHGTARVFEWNNDLAEATNEAANQAMILSNHSYGITFNGDNAVVQRRLNLGAYNQESRDWDNLLFNSPNYLAVMAAGNDGDVNLNDRPNSPGAGLWDKLSGFATSKNTLVVANAQAANIDANGNLVGVNIAASSSQGPTDDMRIKPDIAGHGVNILSSHSNADNSYASETGTSMAAPNVTGTLLLLQQHYRALNNENTMRAATLKGLALHTADDAGVNGPDATFGWGLLNAKKAVETIIADNENNNNTASISELTLNNNQVFNLIVTSDGNSPLFASISWTDRPGAVVGANVINSNAPVLINDLDIRVRRIGDNNDFLPYELTGPNTNARRDNNVDNYERIDIANPVAGNYRITVSHKGNLTGNSQNYSLIVTGTSNPICNAAAPNNVDVNVNVNNITTTSASVNWDLVNGTTYQVRYRIIGTQNWTTNNSNENAFQLNNLVARTQYEVQVRSVCGQANSNYSNSINFTTLAAQINYCASNGNTEFNTGITRVVFGSINNADGPDKNIGYEDFTNLSATVNQGSNVNLTVSVNSDGNVRVDAFAWIDWNQDGDFNDNGEAFDLGNISNVNNVALPVRAIAVPANAVLGNTRMRISARYNSNPTPCLANFDGEVEDYTVTVRAAAAADNQAPTAPTNLTISNLTQTTLTLNWTASADNVGVTEYQIYRDNVQIGTSANTTFNVTGLAANTAYNFRVNARDAANNTSGNSNIANITTPNNYCASAGTRVLFEWIDLVSFGGMVNATRQDQSNGYADYTAVPGLLANVSRGSNQELIVSAGFSAENGPAMEFFKVWIDYNGDGVFTVGERVYENNSNEAGNRVTNVLIPADARIGRTRMRVSMKYNAASEACEANLGDGEVEDYTVNITAAVNAASTSSNTINEVIEEQQNIAKITLYPNPSSDFIKVLNNNIKVNDANYKIVNLIGQTIKKGKLSNKIVDISDLKKGIYIFKLVSDKKEVITKFIKN